MGDLSFFQQNISHDVWQSTYKWETDTDVFSSFRRSAKAIAQNEKDKSKWEEIYFNLLSSLRYVSGGRILSNAGTGLKGTTYINCFVSGFEGKSQDSIGGIFDALKKQALILKSEGGYGFCLDVLRPRHAYVRGIGNDSPGAVEFLRLWNVSSSVITAGSGKKKPRNKKGKKKIRKGAQMCTMSIWNPSIVEFITAKQTSNKFEKINMSVLITDDFMEAVKKKKPWDLIFPDPTHAKYDEEWDGNIVKWKANGYPVVVWETLEDANELWDVIMTSTYNRNEPGVIFIDRYNNLNNLWYIEHISATNPCLTGDTLVALADGRGSMSLKALAEEGKDVDVYCLDDNGNTVIRIMRNPRVTGKRKKVYKVTLDTGDFFTATDNHEIHLKDGSVIPVKYLKKGDSLSIMSRVLNPIVYNSGRKRDYWWIVNGRNGRRKTEHKLIAEHFNNTIVEKGYQVHHKDFNSKNNIPSNLDIMKTEDHKELHAFHMRGNNNPMRRYPEKNHFNDPVSQQSMREKNHIGAKRSAETKEKISKTSKERFSNPSFISKFSQKVKDGVRRNKNNSLSFLKRRAEKYLLECKSKTDLECVLSADGMSVKAVKQCETCEKDFKVSFNKREQGFCSLSCANAGTAEKTRISRINNYVPIREEQSNQVFNLLVKYITENNEVPQRKTFVNLIRSSLGINDLRPTKLYFFLTYL